MKRYFLMFAAILLTLSLFAGGAMAELPDNLTEIGSSAFEGDTELEGVVSLPDTVTTVGSRAFAGTGLHALIIPEGCTSLAADVLAGGNAAYVTLHGAQTTLSASAMTDVPYVFAPAGGTASGMSGFYALNTLCVESGFYFSVSQGEATPLCAVDASVVSGEVTLPKFVEDQPLLQLDTLTLQGCDSLTNLVVPSYLTIPEGVTATTYDAMTMTAPVPSVTECTAGDVVTWTTEVTGAYGDVSYVWTFDTDGTVSSIITATPSVSWSTTTQGTCVASVTAIDSLDDEVSASSSTGVNVGEPIPVYRALLIGNTYPGTDTELAGCDTDVYAMRSMLGSMTGTDFSITTQFNVSSSGIQSAITSTFANARSCDVSLFYFSGHGTSAGALVGVGNTTVSVSSLRTWLDTIPGTKIVIIDCCYSGMMIGKSTDATSPSSFTSSFISGFSSYTKANLADNNYIVMTACSKTELSSSLTSGDLSFGAFTYGVCYGSGYDEWNQTSLGSLPADSNGDGQITLGEAYSTAVSRVSWLSDLLVDAGADALEQSAQYYGDSSFVIWIK